MNHKHIMVDVGFGTIFVHKDDPGISKALRSFSAKRTKWPREPEFMEICADEIGSEDVILDIGANIGFMTAFFSTLVKEGPIYAVEPAPQNIKILKRNMQHLELEDRVEITQGAFSDKDGTAFLELSGSSNLHALFRGDGENRVSVKTFNLSNFLSNRAAPNFVKMDVEGAEVEILEGFKSYTSSTSHRLKILIELHPNYYSAQRDFCEQLIWYGNHGFCVKKLVSATIACPPQITARGYQPIAVFTQGGYSRGIYDGVSPSDAVDFIKNSEAVIFTPPSRKNRLLGALGLPAPKAKTTKIVRGILLERS